MLASKASECLVQRFELDQVEYDDQGRSTFWLKEPFTFGIFEIGTETITLIAPLDFGDSADRETVMRRLLESNLQGCETGAGALGLIEGYGICYRETIDLKDMDLDAFQSRFVDFSLYVYYWMTDGIKVVQEETTPPIMGEGMIRL